MWPWVSMTKPDPTPSCSVGPNTVRATAMLVMFTTEAEFWS